MLVTSGKGTPKFIFPLDAITLLPGFGEFTCCALDHFRHGGIVDCDKVRVLGVMKTLLKAKSQALLKAGNMVDFRYFVAMTHWFLRGLTEAGAKAEALKGNAPAYCPPSGVPLDSAAAGEASISALKTKLQWTAQDDVESQNSGWTLLRYAVLSNDVLAAKTLLDPTKLASMSPSQRQRYIDSPLKKQKGEFIFVKGQITIIDAMAWAGPEMIKLLLDAGASEMKKNHLMLDPLMSACATGRHENIDAWFDLKPGWDMNKRRSNLGLQSLHYGLFMATTPFLRPTAETLIKHGADLGVVTQSGRTSLHSLCMNEDCEPKLLDDLLDSMLQKNPLDYPQYPHGKFKILEGIASFIYKRGKRGNLIEHLVLINKSSALHATVRHGDAACSDLLLKRGADTRQKNAGKMDVHDVCQLCGPFETLSGELKASEAVGKGNMGKAEGVTPQQQIV